MPHASSPAIKLLLCLQHKFIAPHWRHSYRELAYPVARPVACAEGLATWPSRQAVFIRPGCPKSMKYNMQETWCMQAGSACYEAEQLGLYWRDTAQEVLDANSSAVSTQHKQFPEV